MRVRVMVRVRGRVRVRVRVRAGAALAVDLVGRAVGLVGEEDLVAALAWLGLGPGWLGLGLGLGSRRCTRLVRVRARVARVGIRVRISSLHSPG